MLKFLLILFVLVWLSIRVGGFIVKMLFAGAASQQRQTSNHQQRSQQKPSDGNVNIDYIPDAQKGRKRKSGGIKGGDYVDYEEVN